MSDLFDDQLSAAEAPKLPNMNEFSPGVLGTDIQDLLKCVAAAGGDTTIALTNIVNRSEKIRATQNAGQRTGRARNVLIGMSQCGLVKKSGRAVTPLLTEVGESIKSAVTTEEAARVFARHLIENHHGLELFDIVRMLRSRGDAPSLENIRDELVNRGFKVTENEGNPSKIRQWLEVSGVVDENWNINDKRLLEVVGATSSVLSEWHGLPRERRVFLEVLKEVASFSPSDWYPVRKIKGIAESRYGSRVFPTGRLRDRVIDPLRSDGWLDARGKGPGRGGDSGEVQALPQLIDLSIKLPLEDVGRIPADLRGRLSTPLDVIFQNLNSSDTGTKGAALELLALNILRDIGLTPVGFRLRSAKTQGAEVDLIAEGANLLFSRWLVQCKNTPGKTLEVEQIAKEAGLALVMQAHVIIIVTTGRIGRAVQMFADGLARTSSLQAVLIDGAMLKAYRASKGAGLIDALNANARRLLQLKSSQREQVSS